MLVALLLAAAQTSTASPQVAEAKAHLRQEAEANRAAIEQAIKHRLIGSGYFQMVSDKAEERLVIAGLQKRLRSLGIPATLGKCDWIGLVAEGVKGGNLSYGAACRVRIAANAPADFLICDASLGGLSLIKPEWHAFDADYVELFIRRTCL
jgi:hypothetical protein